MTDRADLEGGSPHSDDSDRESRIMVIDIEQLITDEAYERGLDPKGLEVIRSKTSEKTNLVVQVEGQPVNADMEE